VLEILLLSSPDTAKNNYQQLSALLPTILTVAGSDPSGGAGVQADIKTFTTIGVYGAAAVTCITVQNSRGVSAVHPLPFEYVKEQVEAVLDDHRVTHIKIGMVGTLQIARALEKILQSFHGQVIYDPVLASTGGQELFEPDSIRELKSTLVDTVTILTPNRSELELLCSKSCLNELEMRKCADVLFNRFNRMEAIVLKGGHVETDKETLTDILVTRSGREIIDTRPRHQHPHLHGTGCTYASAFSAYHSLTGSYKRAFHLSGQYMDQLITRSMNHQVAATNMNGPLLHHLVSGQQEKNQQPDK